MRRRDYEVQQKSKTQFCKHAAWLPRIIILHFCILIWFLLQRRGLWSSLLWKFYWFCSGCSQNSLVRRGNEGTAVWDAAWADARWHQRILSRTLQQTTSISQMLRVCCVLAGVVVMCFLCVCVTATSKLSVDKEFIWITWIWSCI